jgi:hypothetical protein
MRQQKNMEKLRQQRKAEKSSKPHPGLLGRRERKVKTQSQGKPVTDWQF